jgi:hypothetical protein
VHGSRYAGRTLDASAMIALISVWSFWSPALPADGPARRLTRLAVWLLELIFLGCGARRGRLGSQLSP